MLKLSAINAYGRDHLLTFSGKNLKVNISTLVEMDPSGIQTLTDSTEKNQLKIAVTSGITELTNSDGESLTEIGNSDNDLDEEKKSCSIDDSDSEKSVHIIFLRGDSESASNADSVNTAIEVEGTSVKSDVGGKSSLQDSPTQKVRVSGGSCGTAPCPSQIFDISSEGSGITLDKLPVSEVEDDFDASEGIVFQVDQKPSRDTNPRKKKKKFFKVCKACGDLVERQDFVPHIKEHRRRKLELLANSPHRKNDAKVRNVNSLSPEEKKSAKTDVPLADSGIGSADNIPQSSMSTSLADRPFKCSVCTETFRTQSSLTIHFMSHSGDCSNSCPVS